MTTGFGLLWYDGNPRRSLKDKVLDAAHRYNAKYGGWPNAAYVHLSNLDQNDQVSVHLDLARTIYIFTPPNALKNHIFVFYHEYQKQGGKNDERRTD